MCNSSAATNDVTQCVGILAPTVLSGRIRRQERGMAALLDRPLNVLAAALVQRRARRGVLSFAGKFVISR